MSIIPTTKPKYQYSKVRFFEREHGVEFLNFEWEQMKTFALAQKQTRVEVTGYVSWCRPPYFLLLPTTTTSNIRLICKVENELHYPDLNQYSTIRGKWIMTIINNKPVKALQVSDIHKSKPDFGKIKPDIRQKDFVEILFERWRNVRDVTQELIAQNFVSSPTMNQRTGGFTLTLANYTKKNALRVFFGDLKRFIPTDFTKNKSFSFEVPELGTKSNLPKFGWDDNVANLNNIPKRVDNKLDRIPNNMVECSVTLLQETMGPVNFDVRGLTKSDYPIVLEEYVEQIRNSYDVNPEVYKFILATRLSSPTVSLDVYNKSIEHAREKLTKFSELYETLAHRVGNNQFLDLGIRGKPLSIHNLAISFGRSDSLESLSTDEVIKASEFYLENLDDVMDVQERWGYDKIPAAATMTFTERRVYLFLGDHFQSTMKDISESLKMPIKDIEKAVNSLLLKSAIIESALGKYSSVPN